MAYAKPERSSKGLLSWRNPLKWFFAAAGRGETGSDASSSSTGHSGASPSQTVYTGSFRSSIATLYSRDYPLSAELIDFLKINSSCGERIPQGTVITALQDVARDDERRRAARGLSGNSPEELASLLQSVCFTCFLRLTIFLSFSITATSVS
jgi:hypothetical protein